MVAFWRLCFHTPCTRADLTSVASPHHARWPCHTMHDPRGWLLEATQYPRRPKPPRLDPSEIAKSRSSSLGRVVWALLQTAVFDPRPICARRGRTLARGAIRVDRPVCWATFPGSGNRTEFAPCSSPTLAELFIIFRKIGRNHFAKNQRGRQRRNRTAGRTMERQGQQRDRKSESSGGKLQQGQQRRDKQQRIANSGTSNGNREGGRKREGQE